MGSFFRGLRRSFLFVPGHNRKMIGKAAGSDADCVILDLEDSVPLEKKKEAREISSGSLTDMDFGKKEVAVRINSIRTSYWEDDLKEIMKANPHTLIISKVEKPETLRELDSLMTTLERDRHGNSFNTSLLGLIETPLSLANVNEIAVSTSRLTGLMFGAGDLRWRQGERLVESVLNFTIH